MRENFKNKEEVSQSEENFLKDEDFDLSNFSEKDEGLVSIWAKKFGLLVFEVVKVVLISLAIIMPVRLFLVQPFYVEGASMEPNFYEKDYLIINEISYHFNEPQRGEVVIFKYPKNPKVYFIKRVIGLPGETVEIQDGLVFVNGQELSEAYVENFLADDYSLVTLGSTEYFLMGDNRANSKDSREIGPVGRGYIIGKVWLRGWPLDRINSFNMPVYTNN